MAVIAGKLVDVLWGTRYAKARNDKQIYVNITKQWDYQHKKSAENHMSASENIPVELV